MPTTTKRPIQPIIIRSVAKVPVTRIRIDPWEPGVDPLLTIETPAALTL